MRTFFHNWILSQTNCPSLQSRKSELNVRCYTMIKEGAGGRTPGEEVPRKLIKILEARVHGSMGSRSLVALVKVQGGGLPR